MQEPNLLCLDGIKDCPDHPTLLLPPPTLTPVSFRSLPTSTEVIRKVSGPQAEAISKFAWHVL